MSLISFVAERLFPKGEVLPDLSLRVSNAKPMDLPDGLQTYLEKASGAIFDGGQTPQLYRDAQTTYMVIPNATIDMDLWGIGNHLYGASEAVRSGGAFMYAVENNRFDRCILPRLSSSETGLAQNEHGLEQ